MKMKCLLLICAALGVVCGIALPEQFASSKLDLSQSTWDHLGVPNFYDDLHHSNVSDQKLSPASLVDGEYFTPLNHFDANDARQLRLVSAAWAMASTSWERHADCCSG